MCFLLFLRVGRFQGFSFFFASIGIYGTRMFGISFYFVLAWNPSKEEAMEDRASNEVDRRKDAERCCFFLFSKARYPIFKYLQMKTLQSNDWE